MTELKNFLDNSDCRNTVLITDFDGTLYRGSCPFLFRGIANADMGLTLFFLNILNPKKLPWLFFNLFRLFFYEKFMRFRYKTGSLTLSELDEKLIRFFAKNILAVCSPDDLDNAASALSSLCYGDAWIFFKEIKNKSSLAAVSKSFEFLLEKVKDTAAEHSLEMEIHGVKFENRSIKEDSVLTKENKFNKVKELLNGSPHFQKALILGDTEDDIAMKNAAIEVLDKSNVFFAAVNPKDRKVIAESNAAFKSWKDLLASPI
jgi:hypothetical protein